MSSGGGGGAGKAEVAELIQEWLAGQLEVSSVWTVGKSKFGGRGLFATRDIQPSELIFVDIPIILGPRRSGGPLCVGCHLGCEDGGETAPNPICRLRPCPGGCRLPVCSERCAASPRHVAECRLLSPRDAGDEPPTAWSMQLFHALAALRSLTLDDAQRNIVRGLQANNVVNQKCWEAETLRQVLGTKLTREQEEWMVQCCRAMDTNAFETVQVPHHAVDQQVVHTKGREKGPLENGAYKNGSLGGENGLIDHGNDSQQNRSHENGLQENGSHNNGLQENGSQDNGLRENGSHENGSKENGSHKNGSHENGSHKNGLQENRSHNNGLQDNGESYLLGRTRGSLRGLYPLGALMNHSCCPNTTHAYDEQCRMRMMASTHIKQGDELFTSYVSQLWDTASRRHMLAKTKQFACRCDRCKDPTEFGSQLSGLPCPVPDCSGLLLSQRPLDYRAPDWRCQLCGELQSPTAVTELQRLQGRLLAGIDTSDPDHVIAFLDEGRVPATGIVAVQLKAGLNLFLGHVDGYKLQELSDEHLKVKEKICRDLLSVMDKLKIGNTRLKGLNVFDLHLTLSEKMRRIKQEEVNDDDDSDDNMRVEIIKTWELAKKILSHDATAPKEFHEKLITETRAQDIVDN